MQLSEDNKIMKQTIDSLSSELLESKQKHILFKQITNEEKQNMIYSSFENNQEKRDILILFSKLFSKNMDKLSGEFDAKTQSMLVKIKSIRAKMKEMETKVLAPSINVMKHCQKLVDATWELFGEQRPPKLRNFANDPEKLGFIVQGLIQLQNTGIQAIRLQIRKSQH